MRCYNCGYENEDGVSFCHECGVNLKTFDENVDGLKKDFKVVRKGQSYPAPSADSIKAKLMYKYDKHNGRLRLAKTKCATLIVFCAFTGFGLILTLTTGVGVTGIFVSILFGLVFAAPVAIIGFIIGYLLEKVFN
ncbi:hypothetical protein [Methanobrevibacter sp.]|uniref:hypothetical protein n=1 Tax=Methanobrevibacter sp. TaxID=66852 RepID=UPI00388DB8A5